MYYNLDVMRDESQQIKELANAYKHTQALYLRALVENDMSSAMKYRYAGTLILTEDPLKARAITDAVRSTGGIPMVSEVRMKLESRASELPMNSTNFLGE